MSGSFGNDAFKAGSSTVGAHTDVAKPAASTMPEYLKLPVLPIPLEVLSNTVTFSGTGELTELFVNAGIGSATTVIIEGYTSIGMRAFFEKINIKSVIIGHSVTTIGTSAFRSCSSLISIIVDVNNISYSSIEEVLFNKSETIRILFSLMKLINLF